MASPETPDSAPRRKRRRWPLVVLVILVVVSAGAGIGYWYTHRTTDFADISASQGFLSTASDVTDFIQWQEGTGGTLSGSFQLEDKSSGYGATASNSYPLTGSVNGTHVVITVTVNGSKNTWVGTLSADGLSLTYPSSDGACGGRGDTTDFFRLTTVQGFNRATRQMTGKSSCN